MFYDPRPSRPGIQSSIHNYFFLIGGVPAAPFCARPSLFLFFFSKILFRIYYVKAASIIYLMTNRESAANFIICDEVWLLHK
jgi:hypothetical protein